MVKSETESYCAPFPCIRANAHPVQSDCLHMVGEISIENWNRAGIIAKLHDRM